MAVVAEHYRANRGYTYERYVAKQRVRVRVRARGPVLFLLAKRTF